MFWIVAGWHPTRLPHLTVASAGASSLLILFLSAPIVALAVRPASVSQAQTSVGLIFFSAAREVSGSDDYRVYARFKVPPGTYRASLNACFPSCMAIDMQTFQAGTQGAELVVLRGILPEGAKLQMELRLHSGRSSFDLRPITPGADAVSRAGLRFIGGPTLGLSALLTWQVVTFSPSVPPLTLAVPALDCAQPPAFRVEYKREAGGVRPAGDGRRFMGEGWLQADACTPGTLTLRAQGIRGGDDLPRLRVGLNSEVVFDQPFDAARTVRIHIPRAGRITVGYFNDYYRAEARVAQLTRWQFAGRACSSFKIDVPAETGGSWQPELNAASLVRSVPMNVTPCSAGQLTVRLSGRPGDGVFPLIVVKQRGRALGRVQTSAAAQNVSFTVSDAPVSLYLANPYFKELADRNVMVSELTLTPDGR